MSSPATRLKEAEKQLRIAADDIDGHKGEIAGELAGLVAIYREGVDDA